MLCPRAVATGVLLSTIAFSAAWIPASAFTPAVLQLRRDVAPAAASARRSARLGGLAMGKQPVLEKDKNGEWVLRLETELSGAWAEDGARRKEWFAEQEEQRVRKVQSVRVSHILVETKEMASSIIDQLRAGEDFSKIAGLISNCEFTREEGGAIGWVSEADAFLDETLPSHVRVAALRKKPGDVLTMESGRGVHLVKIEDIMYDLAAGLTTVPRAQPYGRDGGAYFRPLKELMDKDESFELTYSIETMGCQMNTADSERIAGQLEQMGIKRTDSPSKASVVIYNTCSIRDHAEQKVYSYMGPQAERKRKGESVAIVVAGCVAQQEGEQLLRRVPEIDLVMGPQYANRVGDLLESVFSGNQVVATDAAPIMEDISQPRRGSETCAWVNIIYGCNERCTYCVVPTTRGVEQSRPKESIRTEIEALASEGFKEVTLLGQNIDAWGRDMEPKNKFSDLLAYLADVPGIERIRFTTSHPRYMSLSVVETIAKHQKLCKSIHLPFQSGDDKVLKEMGRGHTVEQYLKIIRRIKELMPDAAITADAIVGFPGETEEEFENTLNLMREVKFDMTNTAAYSPRPNTPAAAWHNQVTEDVKADRLQRINRLGTALALERSQRYLGRTLDVLVEERNVKNPAQVKGRIEQGRPVFFEGDIDETKGKLVLVEIVRAEAYYLVGRQVHS